MKRKIIVVTTAYGHEQVRAMGGQASLLPLIAQAGADGVEIRREMFSDAEIDTLPALAEAIRSQQLFACYSAPEPLFMPTGEPNPYLAALLDEARILGAGWLKMSLGHFQHTSALESIRTTLNQAEMLLVVENDQTECGRLAPMQRFSTACQQLQLPVSLTFDIGNWLWAGDSPEQAAPQLAPSVSYIHVKGVELNPSGYHAVPPDGANPYWLELLKQLPADTPRGIEFPLQGNDLVAVTQHYVNLLREE